MAALSTLRPRGALLHRHDEGGIVDKFGIGQPVRRKEDARLLTFASWGFYPLVYMIPFTGLGGGSTETAVQIGYTIADLVSKVGLGILVYQIAVRKTAIEYAASDTSRGIPAAVPAE